MNNISSSIIHTLCYADIFDYPLKQSEIFSYLIWENNSPPPTRKKVIPTIFDLTKTKKILHNSGYFYLPGKKDNISKRKKRHRSSQEKLKKAQEYISQISQTKYIKGIFISGNLAMENADNQDDIDLLIITKLDRLWTTRLKVTLTLHLKGTRRTPTSQNINNLICTNMYLDETSLAVPPNKRNLYTAHEVIQVKPIINNDSIYQQFLFQNSWVNNYLPNFKISEQTSPKLPTSQNTIESLAYQLQLAYMKRKITREIISPHMAYFHPRNTSKQTLDKYRWLAKKHST